MTDKRILIVDDDPQIATLLEALLERDGFEARVARSGREMWERLGSEPISLITLDVNLAGEDGFSLAREIRARLDVPIIMISGKADEIDRVVGLELGADDYITKPFNLREVLARVKAVLRRYEPRPSAMAAAPIVVGAPAVIEASAPRVLYRFGVWTLDVAGRRIDRDGAIAPELTTAEFNLLLALVERPRRVLSRGTLLDLLRGVEWSPLDRSIDTLVGRLRKKIESDPEHPTLVKTVRGVGYVFTADVVRT